MKKAGNTIIKIFCGLTVILIIITAGILLYPKYAEKLGLEDRVQDFCSETEQTTEEMTEETSQEEMQEPVKELPVETEKPELSGEQQDAIHEAYKNIIQTMQYDEESVLFYKIMEVNDRSYYAFQIIDGEGDTFEYLLLSDTENRKLYWCDSNNQLGDARSTDVLYSADREGKVEAAYEDDSWEKVLEGYMKALLEQKDLELAESYVDFSYYYKTRMSEKERKKNIEGAIANQGKLVGLLKDLDQQKEDGKLLKYDVIRKTEKTEEMADEEGATWMDVSVHVTLSEEKRDRIEKEELHYLVSLRRYPYGWRVATLLDR